MRPIFLLIITSYISNLFGKEPIVFYALLNSANEAHKLYLPTDKNPPTPYYKKECQGVSLRPYLTASGSATFIFYPDSSELHYAIAYSGLSSPPLMLHIHLGPLGQEGPILGTIFGRPYEKPRCIGWFEEKENNIAMAPKGLSGFVSGTYILGGKEHITPPLSSEEEVTALLRGGFYINLHTCLNQMGEIRGQVLPLAVPQ